MTQRAPNAHATTKADKRGRAAERLAFNEQLQSGLDHAALAAAVGEQLAMAPMAFPAASGDEWVPIGPTVTRRGQAMSRPRVSGRIRDLAVSPDGQRAYASSAKGGLWYTDDAGATWTPIGGWAGRSVNPLGNGNMFSGGALLVDFSGGFAGTDVVLLGTGEPVPFQTETNTSAQGGVGVLAALGPAFDPVASDPWEPDTGISPLGGLGVWRLARHPAATAFSIAPADQDRVLAATTNGLFLGTRSHLPAVVAKPPPAPMQPPVLAQPARDGYTWAACAAAAPAVAPNRRDVTDVLWLANGAGSRIVYAVGRAGVFFSDNNGGAATAIAALQAPGVAFNNRISLALVPGTSRVYVLAEVMVAGVPTASVWQITDVLAAPQGVVAVPGGVPTKLFGDPAKPPTQAWYDHGFAVEIVGANDRLYLGGSTVKPRNDAEGEWSASLWCLETPSPPAAIAALTAPANLSRAGNPPTGSGADVAGLIGNNVHADIHAIRLPGATAPTRPVWVGCDGGVYVSDNAGRVNTFAARNTGLATLEPVFLGAHPTSSHFQSAGFQDNGTQIRVGDTVWEEVFVGDGGGTVFHPIRSDILVAQYTRGRWNGTPASDYLDPITRSAGHAGNAGREGARTAFYSGAATIADTANTGRLAIGTNRVWLTDNLGGSAATLRWRVLPYPNGTQTDARPNGNDPQPAFGVPGFVNPLWVDALGNSTADNVIDMVWQNGTVLLVLYRNAIVRYTNTNKATGAWTTTTWQLGAGGAIPFAANTRLTALATVANSLDYYVGTLGDQTNTAIDTVWFYDNALGTFTATGLRRKLDFAGPPIVAGPRDPCFALMVDPIKPGTVYAGTATGVWVGIRNPPAAWKWDPYMNGLPQATVQDLDIWQDPVAANAATSPRLLRAAMQSRGVWEVDLARASTRRTYVRVHPRDDRRILPTPMANPRRRPTAAAEPVFASPDIVIRPAWPQAAAPAFHSTIQIGNLPVYDIWTFQTAFRWLYPSCVADGQWSDAMRDLIRFHRQVLGLSAGAMIDKAMWQKVVGGGAAGNGVRLLPDPVFSDKGTVTSNAADSLAVYRAPWQTTLNFGGPATEIDLLESVLPVRSTGDEWTVFREKSTVDVLLHHRDSRIVQPPAAFAMLLWRAAPTSAGLVSTATGGLRTFFDGVAAAGIGGAAPATPAGWNIATQPNGSAMFTVTKPLDARLPRAVPIDIDLSAVPEGQRVVLLAMVGSTADDPVPQPVNIPPGNNPPANVGEFVRAWPNAAMRIVRVTKRV